MAKKETGTNIVTEWVPNPKQQALLDILLDPYHRMASVTRICELAECSRNFYYDQFRIPEFANFYKTSVIDAVKQKSGQLVNIGIREARKGGQAGLGYWKELIKMGELVQPENSNLTFTGEMVIRFEDPETEQDDEDDN